MLAFVHWPKSNGFYDRLEAKSTVLVHPHRKIGDKMSAETCICNRKASTWAGHARVLPADWPEARRMPVVLVWRIDARPRERARVKMTKKV
jgi:hypothetical protein